MAATAKIIDLRKLLAERFPHPAVTATTRLVTGLPFLDQATTGGGLPRGAITELISPRTSAGSASLTNALIHGANRDNYFVALIDGRDSFDPCVVLNSPEELRKISQTNWYRLQRLVELIPAACLVLTRYEMVGSAQLKLVLENSWNLKTFEMQDAVSQLRIVVKRSHGRDIALRCVAAATAARRPYLTGAH